ncbi:hypothetical protein CEQ21_15130 [Niallia circulans]|uniref:Uncharacterized protein n=1 Tax=Niallia circulans TaxID=1397 RepID=A0A553SIN1_NIACI|nr:hypothetical protein [Niallia circulans]TRZ36840.1 hypothetical protein CEQ21_15130 [Niallia circulans]
MKGFSRLAELWWQGITLQHVSHKGIMIPYLAFLVVALMFELFLAVLIVVSCFIFYVNHHWPATPFYIGAAILALLIGITISSVLAILQRKKIT